jgi:hypothetical protein
LLSTHAPTKEKGEVDVFYKYWKVYVKYILCIDFKFGILNLKIFMIIMILCKHCMESHNVCTHWMYLPVVNIGLKMVL